jgi:predicted transcriptional regulator
MQQSDFFGQLELPTSISRTAKDGSIGYTQIDNRALFADRSELGLKRGDKEIHHMLLSLPNDWNFRTVVQWVAKREKFSIRTAYRTMARLEEAGLVPRCWHQKSRENTRHVFEIACPDRPRGKDAKKRHVVMARKECHAHYQKSPSMPRKHHGCLVVSNPEKAFLDPKKVVPNLSVIQRTKDFLHSSENPSTPPPPIGGQEILDDFRVCGNEGTPDKPARRAKRRKGRSSPGRPHNARQPKRTAPPLPRLSRMSIDLGHYRATPDAAEFMLNLTTQLKPAREALRNLPEPNTQPWIDALMANPILSVAQEVYGYSHWGAKELRSFVKSLGRRVPLHDLLLCWVGMNSSWSADTSWDMQRRLTRNWYPTDPDRRGSQVQPDLVMDVHNWHRNVDSVRESLSEQCTKAVNELRDGVDLDDPETIVTHPMIWTAVLASPLAPEEFIDADVVALARETLVPVSRAAVDEWVTQQSSRMLCRWNGRFCTGDIEVLIGRGICRVLEEWYEFDMVNMSNRRGSRGDYSYATAARVATISHVD